MRIKDRGFTLVELSIVLVIIGLLIGGILVAQSLLSTSKITAQVSQIQQFDAAIENFKTKYAYLPGDAPQFGGDGSGTFNATNGAGCCGPNVDIYICEVTNFWYDLFPDKFAPGACSSSWTLSAYNSGPNQNVPLAKMGSNGASVFAITPYQGGDYYTILPWPAVPGTSRYYNTRTRNGAFTGTDSLALDQKMDDGLPFSGNVQMGYIDDSNNPYGGPTLGVLSNSLNCVSGSAYKAGSNYYCTPFIRMGGQVGDPQ